MVAGTQEESGEDVLQFGGAWLCSASLHNIPQQLWYLYEPYRFNTLTFTSHPLFHWLLPPNIWDFFPQFFTFLSPCLCLPGHT